MNEIESEGHRNWVPLPMDQSPEQVGAALHRRFGPPAGTVDEVLDLNLSAAQGVAANLQRQAAASIDDGVVVCAGWVLVLEPSRFEIRAVAVMRAMAVVPGTSADDLIQDLLGEEVRHGEPLVEEFETWSGEAFAIRYRPVVEVDGEREVHQVNAVLWDRAEQGIAYVLSCYVDNLIEANEVGDLLDELAAGMKGI